MARVEAVDRAAVVAFLVKLFIFCWLQILVRWTYPRLRYDQLMNLGWKRLLPIGLRIYASSGVGDSLLDVVVGLGVPATLLGVLCFRWVARLAGAETGDSGRG